MENLILGLLDSFAFDDFVGRDGQDLANEISDLLIKMTNDNTRK